KLAGELDGSSRGFAEPERDRGRSATGVNDDHFAAGDLTDHPGSVTEQEYVAAVAFDGEILVHRADDRFLSFGNDVVLGLLVNCSSRRDCRNAGVAGLENAVDLVPVEIASRFVSRLHTFRKHLDDVVIVLP